MKKNRKKPAYFHPVLDVKTIAAFDFDGTITRKDTMTDFIRFVKGDTAYFFGLVTLSPILLGYLFRLIGNQNAKERLLAYFFKDTPESEMYEWGEKYYTQRLQTLIRPKAAEAIEWHKAQGNRLFLITASLTFWTQSWAEANGFTLIASEPEIKEGLFTGKIKGQNCYKQQKVNRLLALLNDSETYRCYAYGDTSGDTELLRWADIPHYRVFE